MIWVKMEFCSLIPGSANTASSRVIVSVVPVASSIAAATVSASAPSATSTQTFWNTSSPTAAPGRDSASTPRQVSGSTHRPPCCR